MDSALDDELQWDDEFDTVDKLQGKTFDERRKYESKEANNHFAVTMKKFRHPVEKFTRANAHLRKELKFQDEADLNYL